MTTKYQSIALNIPKQSTCIAFNVAKQDIAFNVAKQSTALTVAKMSISVLHM